MVKYLMFSTTQEVFDIIKQIDNCMSYPNDSTITWSYEPIEYNGMYGVMIKDRIIHCLTDNQISSLIEIEYTTSGTT